MGGSKGIHHCEGSVRGPDGQFATMSSFDYTATQPRFTGFWHVPLSDSSPQGNWIFESRVDGEQAGQLAFQVVASAKPANLVKPAALPTPAELSSGRLRAQFSWKILMITGICFDAVQAFS
jgi:hypothetical protein